MCVCVCVCACVRVCVCACVCVHVRTYVCVCALYVFKSNIRNNHGRDVKTNRIHATSFNFGSHLCRVLVYPVLGPADIGRQEGQ